MLNKVRAFLIMAAILINLAGCGKTENTASPVIEPKKIKVGMITDVLGLNDQVLNASTYRGLKEAGSELQIRIEILKSKLESDYEINLATLARNENDLTLGVGPSLAKALEKVAKDNPDKKFGLVDSSIVKDGQSLSLKNVVWVKFREEEGSFLMGVIAAKMTKTKSVGFLGGIETDRIKQREYGFRAGVAAVDPTIGILSGYAASVSDSAKIRALAKSMYSQGADVIYHASGDAGKGLFEAAVEYSRGGAKVWAIGDESDQTRLAPDNILSSMIISADNAVYDIAKRLAYGEWKGGQVLTFGLKEGGIDIAPTTNKNTPQEVADVVDTFKKKIITGEISVPKTKAEFNNYMLKLPK